MFTDLFKTRFLPMMEGEGGGGTGAMPPTEPSAPNEPPAELNAEQPKSFTQEDLNRIAANEKRQGMSSILRTLGFEKEEDAKAFVEKYKELEDSKKDDLAKAQENLETEKKAKEEAEKKAELLNRKFKVVAAGVSADKVDDIVILATAKMMDGKTFEDVLEDLKKAYPSFFETDSSNTGLGTGTGGNPPRGRNGGSSAGSIGKRLAEQKKTGTSQKKSYFSN